MTTLTSALMAIVGTGYAILQLAMDILIVLTCLTYLKNNISK